MDWWDWRVVRGTFARRLEAARERQGLTQKRLAAEGGLSGQNAVSKLLDNYNKGPSVETFLRAIKGLNMTPSSFFAELERRSPSGGGAPLALPLAEADSKQAHLERSIGRLVLRAIALAGEQDTEIPERRRASRDRAHDRSR